MPQCKMLLDKTRQIQCDLWDKDVDMATRFWETAQLPLPKVNINTHHSLYVSGKLPTFPSPSVNIDFREG